MGESTGPCSHHVGVTLPDTIEASVWRHCRRQDCCNTREQEWTPTARVPSSCIGKPLPESETFLELLSDAVNLHGTVAPPLSFHDWRPNDYGYCDHQRAPLDWLPDWRRTLLLLRLGLYWYFTDCESLF